MNQAVAYPIGTYLAAAAALAACLWIGGFGLELPQQVVRDGIHAAPRALVQGLVQVVVPALLLGFLLRGLVARRR